jgi:hypothetical protein
VAEDDRIVIDVDDSAFRGDRRRDLVHVVSRRQAGTDIEELADARLTGKEPDRATQELTVLLSGPNYRRHHITRESLDDVDVDKTVDIVVGGITHLTDG